MGNTEASEWVRKLQEKVGRGEYPGWLSDAEQTQTTDRTDDRTDQLIRSRLQPRGVREYLRIEAGGRVSGEVLSRMLDLIDSDRWNDQPSFLLSGLPGCGKTTALSAAGIHTIRARRSVWYMPITMLGRVLKYERPCKLESLEDCGLLLLDELHRFSDLPGWIRSEVVALIDHRYGNIRQTGAAGTLPPAALSEAMGREIFDRFDIHITSTEDSYR